MPSRALWTTVAIAAGIAVLALAASAYVVVGQVVAADRVTVAEEKAKSLGEQVAEACAKGGAAAAELGPHACQEAVEVQTLPDPNDPDPDDPERQDPEIQDSETQEPEVQDPEGQDGEADDPEIQESEVQDPEVDDPPVPGPAGQPPAGWTWVDGDGREQSCTRDPGSPDTAPTYTCAADPPRNTLPIPIPGGGQR